MKKVMIATPMYNSVCQAGYVISLTNLLTMKTNDIEFTTLFALNESLIPKTRSMMVSSFLHSDCTHLLFIDSDIQFLNGDVIKMIEADEDVVCGIYCKKSIKWDRIEQAVKSGVTADTLPLFGSDFLVYPVDNGVPNDKGLVEVEKAPTGMMLIKREVFEKLSDKVDSFLLEDRLDNVSETGEPIKEYFKTMIEPETGIFLHEDFTFCRLCREAGIKIYAASWMKLFHIGTHTYG